MEQEKVKEARPIRRRMWGGGTIRQERTGPATVTKEYRSDTAYRLSSVEFLNS